MRNVYFKECEIQVTKLLVLYASATNNNGNISILLYNTTADCTAGTLCTQLLNLTKLERGAAVLDSQMLAAVLAATAASVGRLQALSWWRWIYTAAKSYDSHATTQVW